jgi:hypothetical protein
LRELAQVVLSEFINTFLKNQNSGFNLLGIIGLPVFFLVIASEFLRHVLENVSDVFSLLPEDLLFRLNVSQNSERVVSVLRYAIEGEVKHRDEQSEANGEEYSH